jgi:hypothetical protein
MLTFPRDDWRFVLWSTFTLELLARASLASTSATLLADPKDWNNLLYALGVPPKAAKFSPKSVETSLVFGRLRELVPAFDLELEGFALAHMARRNEELHSGSTPLEGIASSTWLPSFYRACSVCLAVLGETLTTFLGKQEAAVAGTLISAAADASAKQVAKTINAHKVVWTSKSEKERKKGIIQASTWAARHEGHRVPCPACACDALVTGSPIAAPIKRIDEDMITETQQYLPARFECIACGLKIAGLPQLNASGLGDTFKATSTYDAVEYYLDSLPRYEEDFNE